MADEGGSVWLRQGRDREHGHV